MKLLSLFKYILQKKKGPKHTLQRDHFKPGIDVIPGPKTHTEKLLQQSVDWKEDN